MKSLYRGVIYFGIIALTGCSTMNSEFSCNATAGDSCLSIEQVDAMTRFADDVRPASHHSTWKAENSLPNNLGNTVKQHNGQNLWIAKHIETKSWA